ncbi:MAG: hypothetical protein RIS36_939 [Pseudomonadota bacterium]
MSPVVRVPVVVEAVRAQAPITIKTQGARK